MRAAERAQDELKAALPTPSAGSPRLESRPTGGDDVSFERVGSRVSEILGAAAAEAAEITRRAHAKAQALHDESEASSVTSRAEANHYARTSANEPNGRHSGSRGTPARRQSASSPTLGCAASRRQRADAEATSGGRRAGRPAGRAERQLTTTRAAHEERIASLQAEIDAATR